MDLDPVPEPASDLPGSAASTQIEVTIPAPDALPSSGDPAARPLELAPVTRVRPVFPALARSIRAEGRVTLVANVLPDGRVEDARVIECSRSGVGFEDAALSAVRRWRYAPVPETVGTRSVMVRMEFRGAGPSR